jgi:hypothetical protein
MARIVRAAVAVIGALVGLMALLPLLVLSLPFILVSFFTKAICRWFEPHCVPWPKILEYHSVLGWKPRPNLNLHCSFPAGMFHLKTDANGWRGQTNIDDAQMIVIGDSFAFGYGVDDKDAFFSLNHSDLRIKVIGSPGYNMAQEIIWMRQLFPHLRGKLVVWFICLSNDLYDNLLPNLYTYRTPFVRQVNGNGRWEIVSNHLAPVSWPFRHERNFRHEEKVWAVFGNSRLSERAYSACEFLIKEARDICRSADAQLTLITIPWTIQFSTAEWESRVRQFGDPALFDRYLPDRRLGEICSQLGVGLICAREHMDPQDHIPGEGHWNKKGHRRVAEILNALYRNQIRSSNVGIVSPAVQHVSL